MLADLDLLLIAVFCTADDLLPERAKNGLLALLVPRCRQTPP
jgi:hypothetical protein